MTDRGGMVGAPASGVPLDLSAVISALGSIESTVVDDAARCDLITLLETLTCAATGAQAALAVDLKASQVAAQAAVATPVARQGVGVAAMVGLARRESVHRGTFHLGLAELVVRDLPHVTAAWRAGRISEFRVQKIASQACTLDSADRRAFDEQIAGTPESVEVLESLGDKGVHAKAAALAYQLDKQAFVARREHAVNERHTSLRPAADGMTWFGTLVPLKDGVAMHASLTAAATAARVAGDGRGKGQVMADTLVDRVTGRTDEQPVPVHVEVVVPVDVATGHGEHADAPGWVPDYGPIDADLARAWLADDAGSDAATYRRIWADAATGQVVGTETTSAARFYPATMARHARLRDRTCRVPWCDAPVAHIDHTHDHAHGGATSIQNAGGLCEAHNHAKQAHGWAATTSRDPDGTHVITYTTPTGHTHHSRPPPAYPPPE